MINLLPEEIKADIQAARTNVALVQYNLFTVIVLGAILGLCLAFFIFLNATNINAQNTSQINSEKAESFSDVRKAADDYRSNLATAKTILDNSINYTSVIFAITQELPEGVYLDSLNLTANSFGQQTTFSAHAKSYDLVLRLKEKFQNSDIFSNVYLQNVSKGSDGSGGDSSYPVSVTFSAQLEKSETEEKKKAE